MVVVRWHGPFDFEGATAEGGSGLYLCFGRNRKGRPPVAPKLLYCGISDRQAGVGARIRHHEGRDFNHVDNHWWVGRVHYPATGDRQPLEDAEWMIVRFSDCEHNWQKTRSEPRVDSYLVNEWRWHSGEARDNHTGVATVVPDVVGWDATERHLRFAPSLKLLRL